MATQTEKDKTNETNQSSVDSIQDVSNPPELGTDDIKPAGEIEPEGKPDNDNTNEREVMGAEKIKTDMGEDEPKEKLKENKIEEESKAVDSEGTNTDALLDDDTRNRMFNKGLNYDKDGKKDEALKCYLRCLVGLKENTRFALLPQCLRNIGDIYYGKDEYDKAISFIQAEKLYYESVLIDDTELQKHIDEVTAKGDSNEGTDANIDALRATEYEQLARLCLDEKQPQLALEYAGKATKLRQKVYGDGHPMVQQTLDFFATVYAEVGKVQYSESMGKYDPTEEPEMSGEVIQPGTPTTEPTSILRKRKTTDGASEVEKRVHFDETQLRADADTEKEEKCARMVLLVLFITLLLILFILGLYIYCSLNQTTACKNFRRLIIDAIMRVRYLYYHYTTSAKDVQYG